MTRNEFLQEYGGISRKAQKLNHIMQSATNIEDFAHLGTEYHFNLSQVLDNEYITKDKINELAAKNDFIFDEIVRKAVF